MFKGSDTPPRFSSSSFRSERPILASAESCVVTHNFIQDIPETCYCSSARRLLSSSLHPLIMMSIFQRPGHSSRNNHIRMNAPMLKSRLFTTTQIEHPDLVKKPSVSPSVCLDYLFLSHNISQFVRVSSSAINPVIQDDG